MPARELRKQGQGIAAQALLANRPLLRDRPLLRGKWIDELLANAQGAASMGDARSAVAIARGWTMPLRRAKTSARCPMTCATITPRWSGWAEPRRCGSWAMPPAPRRCSGAMAMRRRRREPRPRAITGRAAPRPRRAWR
jgi:hypothetical protein